MRVRPSFAIAAGVLSIYAVVMLWPYLAATLVRGSTVTAWTHLATAPIQGRAPVVLPLVGSTIGADGTILEIVNDRLDPTPVLAAEAALADARLRVAAAAELLEQVQALDQQRRALMKRHAADYRADLDAEIAVREARVVLLAAKAESAGDIATRTGNVADRGYRSRDFHDESRIKVAEAQAELTAERMALERARRRRAASDDGLFLGPDGSSLNWAYGDWQDSKTEVKNARFRLDEARAAEAQAARLLEASREAFRLKQQAPVQAPAGSIIRSIVIGNGATVGVGDPVAKWIDCNDLFIDAPVSDAALPLIAVGSRAEAILEGEGTWRQAKVVGVRGAAETIGPADLAAIAKGRDKGDAQVLLKLDVDARAFGACPVGRAAYVHFPGAGLAAVLLARLGLR
jgi:multidrug resistance efflux pump